MLAIIYNRKVLLCCEIILGTFQQAGAKGFDVDCAV